MNTNDEVKFVYLQSGQTPATPDAGTVYFNPTTKDISVGDVSFKSQPEVLFIDAQFNSSSKTITFSQTAGDIVTLINNNPDKIIIVRDTREQEIFYNVSKGYNPMFTCTGAHPLYGGYFMYYGFTLEQNSPLTTISVESKTIDTQVLIYHGTISSDQSQITFDKTRTEIIDEIKEYFGRYYNTHKEVIIVGYWRGTYNNRDFIFRLNDVNDLSTFLFDTYIRRSDGALGTTTEYKQIELDPSTTSSTASITTKTVYDNPLPYVTSADNGKVLGVTNKSWGTMDIPNGLPAVTGADDGKVLGVTSGAWGTMNLPSSDNIVYYKLTNVSSGSTRYLANNKTIGDIKTDIANGKTVIITSLDGKTFWYYSTTLGNGALIFFYGLFQNSVGRCNFLESSINSSSNYFTYYSRILVPEPTAANRILVSNANQWTVGNFPTELPTVSAADNGSVLKVVNGQWAVGQVANIPVGAAEIRSIDNVSAEGE